jgi:hypothetical protein
MHGKPKAYACLLREERNPARDGFAVQVPQWFPIQRYRACVGWEKAGHEM